MTKRLFDTLVDYYTQTCSACPTQYEGVLNDGRHFYFRYRSAKASLGFGYDIDDAVRNSNYNNAYYGEGLDGYVDEDTFKYLFETLYRESDPEVEDEEIMLLKEIMILIKEEGHLDNWLDKAERFMRFRHRVQLTERY